MGGRNVLYLRQEVNRKVFWPGFCGQFSKDHQQKLVLKWGWCEQEKKKKTEKFWVLDVIVERLHLPALHAVMWNGGLICFEDWGFMVSATYNRRCLNSDSILNQPLIFHLIPNRFIKATSFLSTLSFPPVGRTRNLGVILEHFPSYIL